MIDNEVVCAIEVPNKRLSLEHDKIGYDSYMYRVYLEETNGSSKCCEFSDETLAFKYFNMLKEKL